jgi:hypothetical protein
MPDVTQVLAQIESGDPSAADQLLPLVYDESRKLAAAKLAHEKPRWTLQATALVYEACLRFIAQESAYVRDINDGVQVDIAPLRKADLLAAEVQVRKDVDIAIAERAEWRAEERLGPRRQTPPSRLVSGGT